MVLDRAKRFHRIIGRIRLFFNACPRCNSDAPAVYSCAVCKQVYPNGAGISEENHRQLYPLNLATKSLWWFSWMVPTFDSMQRN